MGNLEEHLISIGDTIEYIPATPNYGRAEFQICPVFRRGYLRECYIYHLQQENITQYHKLIVPDDLKINVIYFSCFPPDNVKIWQTFWCKEHKSHSLELYVPDNRHSFTIETHFGNTLSFNWPDKETK